MIWGPVTVIHIYQLDKLDWHEKHRYNHQKLWNLKILIFWPKMFFMSIKFIKLGNMNHSHRSSNHMYSCLAWSWGTIFEESWPSWIFLEKSGSPGFDRKWPKINIRLILSYDPLFFHVQGAKKIEKIFKVILIKLSPKFGPKRVILGQN